MSRLIKILGVLVFLVTFLQANQCLAQDDWVFFTNPFGGDWYDCNNWINTQWDQNDCNIPTGWDDVPYSVSPDRSIIGSWWEFGTTQGHAIVNEDVNTGVLTVGCAIMGRGILDVLPDANIQSTCFIMAQGLDCVGIVNMYGGAIHCPPTVDPCVNGWAWFGYSGITYWNQYGGDAYFPKINYWGENGRMYINVSGGTFFASMSPVPYKCKVYINVSGTGTVYLMAPWEEFLRPINPGGTWFTVNGGGTLVLRSNWDGYDWVSDPTVNGTLSSDNNVTAVYWNGDPNYVQFTTDACGAIPDADLDKDCDVDFADYASFADGW